MMSTHSASHDLEQMTYTTFCVLGKDFYFQNCLFPNTTRDVMMYKFQAQRPFVVSSQSIEQIWQTLLEMLSSLESASEL